ncbi:hypothetical protein AB0425_38275 [Actinosynnema sp. NPDC051121]
MLRVLFHLHLSAWEADPGHRALAAPLVPCAVSRRPLRYLVRRSTTASESRTREQEGAA